jgi:enoyl-CoA hydratase/carnithine racemase
MFLAAEKVHSARALEMGLVNGIADDPLVAALDTFRDGRDMIP